MEQKNFTVRALDAIAPDAKRRITIRDTEVKGLILRVEPTGSKTFCWLRKANGRVRFKRIGEYPDLSIEQARTAASQHNTARGKWGADEYEGPDPFKHERQHNTLDEVFPEYLTRQI